MRQAEAQATLARVGEVCGVLGAALPEYGHDRVKDLAWAVVARETHGGQVLAVGVLHGAPALVLPGGRLELHFPGMVAERPFRAGEALTVRAVLA